MKKVIFFVLVSILMLLVVSCSPSQQQPTFEPVRPETREEKIETVEVVTEGIGLNEQSALNDSRLKALQQVVGLQVYGQSQATNFTLVDHTVLTRTQGYIQSETILSSGPFQNEYYKVRVRYTVSKEIPNDDFFYVIRRMNKPRIGVWLPSRAYGRYIEHEDRSAEVAMNAVLLDYGFDVYNTERLNELIQIREDGEPDYATLRQYGVDVLVTGEVYGESVGKVAGMEGARANVNLNVYWTQTGQMISAVSKAEGDNDISTMIAAKKAVNRAATAAGEEISKQVIKTWMSNLANGLPLQLSIYNASMDDMIEFRSFLRQAPGVLDVLSPTIEGDYAEIMVYTFLDSFDFYTEIIREYFGTRAKLEYNYLTLMSLRLD